ncbi:allophanate hydrolase [Klenkia terrae]|uniref:Allophanate hydrolase n=1 Tax=Klenkia terrae TaxID=1052259 RepID=A0ABU8E3K2_9ACTN
MTVPGPTPQPTITALGAAFRAGTLTPHRLLADLADRIEERGADGVWISTVPRAGLLARAAELEADPAAAALPLYGIPFAVKDSLDVAQLPTTCACPDFAYHPTTSATVVRRLEAAGAVVVGKTNLDQFATGLNGTRSPYGIPRSVYGADLVSGGSSSGSAVAVAAGLVPFAVATDTAGSGRVPAALNGIPGFKPSRGLISTTGLVPACRSLDCVTLMASTVEDLRLVLDVAAEVDDEDPWSRPRVARRAPRPRIGLPPDAELVFSDEPLRTAHRAATAALDLVGPTRAVPLAPFLAAGDLLYAGPWVAERLVEFEDFLDRRPDSVHPVVADILRSGRRHTAVDTFRAQQRLQELRAEVGRLWREVDVVVLPTVPGTFTVPEVLDDPVATNTVLGTYTHCGNLLDLCAVVVPAGTTTDGRPCSLMVLGPALADDVVLDVGARLAALLGPPQPVPSSVPSSPLVVVGHHLAGQPRNHELTDRGARLVETTCTDAGHRLLRIDGSPPVPALLPSATGGGRIEVEVWDVPDDQLAGFLDLLPPVLVLGRVALADGRTVPGLVCAPQVATGDSGHRTTDITATGGWRRHLDQIPGALEETP